MDEDAEGTTDASAKLTLSWKTVAIGATLVALTAVTTTAVVATSEGVDALSTVALALAVIAFVVQIIVFIVQTSQSTRQETKSQEIHGATMRALSAIEEKTEGTRTSLNLITDKMLDSALGKTLPVAESEGVRVNSPEFSELLAKTLSNLTQSPQSSPSLRHSPRARLRSRPNYPQKEPPKKHAVEKTLARFPEAEAAERIIPVLETLKPRELRSLQQLAFDHIGSDRPGIRMIMGAKELYDAGLIRRISTSWSEDPVFVLTKNGTTAAAILINEPPAAYQSRTKPLYEKIADEEHRVTKILSEDPFPEIPVE